MELQVNFLCLLTLAEIVIYQSCKNVNCVIIFSMYNSSNGGSKASSGGQQPLVQWSEVPGHTGLLYCMSQTSNNPVVLMVKPDSLLVQEIKVVPAKAKIQDVVAIRHNASNSDQVGGYFSCLQNCNTITFLCHFFHGFVGPSRKLSVF